MKISLITIVFNCADTIGKTLDSVRMQNIDELEYIIIDGASTDGTQEIITSSGIPDINLISEKDEGLYDALNKGISKASGDVIGFIHADDFLADESVLSDIRQQFINTKADIVYGDLDYVSRSDVTQIIRKWRSGKFSRRKLKFGWMPPHPTLYVKKDLLCDRFFNLEYKISADYDSILRLFSSPDSVISYIPRVLVKMRVGGVSNQSFGHIIQKTLEDLKIARKNGYWSYSTIFFKNLRKISQFF